MYRVMVPTAFESSLQPEWQGRFFQVWASADTREEAERMARMVPGAKVEPVEEAHVKAAA